MFDEPQKIKALIDRGIDIDKLAVSANLHLLNAVNLIMIFV